MTRTEAIAFYRQLADRLEAADCEIEDFHGFSCELTVHTHYATTESDEYAVAAYWVEALGLTRRDSSRGCNWYDNGNTGTKGKLTVHVPAGFYRAEPQPDLLAGRDVQLVEIGGGE